MQQLVELIPVEGNENDIIARAASLGYLADFSVAELLVKEAKERGLQLLPASKFETIPGQGVAALIDGMAVKVGSPKLLVTERVAVPISFADKITAYAREGKPVMVVLSGRSLSGALVFSKEEVAQAPTPVPEISEVFSARQGVSFLAYGIAILCFVFVLYWWKH